MDFWVQFNKFTPLSGDIPSYPFSYLPDIAWRARQLLKDRTEAQIKALAERIGYQFDMYFHAFLLEEVNSFKSTTGLDIDNEGNIYLEPDYEDETNGFIDPEDPPHELIYGGKKCIDFEGGQYVNWFYIDTSALPTESNSNEVDILKNCEEYWDDICKVKELDNVKHYELFATLSLWLLDDAIDSIKSIGSDSDKLFEAFGNLMGSLNIKEHRAPYSISNAGECALKAMDAVCYAEHLRKIERMRTVHSLELTKAQDALNEKSKQEEEERKRKKERSEQLNQQRHKKRNEAKAMVIAEWERQPYKFPSGEQAGRYFTDWLQQKGISFQPRAVTGWIRSAAKTKGIRFR